MPQYTCRVAVTSHTHSHTEFKGSDNQTAWVISMGKNTAKNAVVTLLDRKK